MTTFITQTLGPCAPFRCLRLNNEDPARLVPPVIDLFAEPCLFVLAPLDQSFDMMIIEDFTARIGEWADLHFSSRMFAHHRANRTRRRHNRNTARDRSLSTRGKIARLAHCSARAGAVERQSRRLSKSPGLIFAKSR